MCHFVLLLASEIVSFQSHLPLSASLDMGVSVCPLLFSAVSCTCSLWQSTALQQASSSPWQNYTISRTTCSHTCKLLPWVTRNALGCQSSALWDISPCSQRVGEKWWFSFLVCFIIFDYMKIMEQYCLQSDPLCSGKHSFNVAFNKRQFGATGIKGLVMPQLSATPIVQITSFSLCHFPSTTPPPFIHCQQSIGAVSCARRTTLLAGCTARRSRAAETQGDSTSGSRANWALVPSVTLRTRAQLEGKHASLVSS